MGNIEYSIAAQYARDMFCDPGFIIGMKKYDRQYAEWAVHVSGMNHALRVRVPFGVLESMPKIPHNRRQISATSQGPLAVPSLTFHACEFG